MAPRLYPAVKRPGNKADHVPPSGSVVKDEWSCISTAPVCIHSVYRDISTLYLILLLRKTFELFENLFINF
jgi:hypothetical protein